MKFIITAVAILVTVMALASVGNAAMTWSVGGPYDGGLQVQLVYPSYPEHKIIFKASDGNFYQYNWDPAQSEITSNAKAVFSLLLTAMTIGKKVSFYYDNSQTGYIDFTLINIHD